MECPLNRNGLTLPQILFIYQTEIVKDNCGGQPAKNIFMPFGIDYFRIFNIMIVEGDEATMKMTPFKLIVAILLLAGMAAFAPANAAEDAMYKRYCGVWSREDFILNLKYEDGEMTGSLMQFEQSGDVVTWDFTHCWYVPESDILWCNGCTHYRVHIDPKTFERTEEDWWLTDLSDIYFAFGDDQDTLIGYEIEDIGEPLVLRREKTA